MGRYTGPTDRLSRREGVNLFLKGERSYNGKTAIEKRPDAVPGEHGKFRSKFSEYGVRLREKQKVRECTASGRSSSEVISIRRRI